MSIYVELTAKMPLLVKVKTKLSIPKKMTLVELNNKLSELEQISATTGKAIPLSLKIIESSVTGNTTIFSNDWGMKAGNPTNILVLVQYALQTYYVDTPEEQKEQLIRKIEEGLEEPSPPVFEVQKQKEARKVDNKTSNILDRVKPQNISNVSSSQEQASKPTTKKGFFSPFSLRTFIPWIVIHALSVVLATVFSVGTTMYMVSGMELQPYTTDQRLPNTTPTKNVSVPFSVYEEGKEEQLPISLTSYMEVDKLSAVKGTTTPNKQLIFKNSAGKTIGKTKSTDKGVFEVNLIEGDK